MRKLGSLFVFFFWMACSLQLTFAQERCGTTMLDAQTHKSPAWQAYEAQARLAYQQQVGTTSKISGAVRVIPTVVHLIERLPTPEISDARVQSQIDVLNEDFRLLNADTSLIPLEFRNVAADCEIQFCLAKIDPNGCPTNGINRVFAPHLAIHGIADEQALKSYVQWDPQKYLNIWVPVNLRDNLLGYATLPPWINFSPESDGVVVNGNNFGRANGTPASSYNLGRTATHEVGHWLGLYHTFDGGCAGMNPQNCMSQGDEVCDTPPTGGPMYGCPSGPFNSCQESPIDMNDQTVNYMDYTDDRCMVMFSQGQRDRMFFYLDTDRAQLWSTSNLTATGCDGTLSPGCRPVANFEASPANTCVGNTIQFQDQTTGGATNWQWTFASGNPSTSTLQNPTVSWTQPGTYAVTLLASNAVGADTLVQNGFVTIAAPRSGPVAEGFEASANLPLEWYAFDEDQSGTWQVSTVTGRSGLQSVFIPNFGTPVQRMQDDLVTHVIDLTGISTPGELTFAHAYRKRDSFGRDSLQVLASTDCGATWQLLWEKWGNALATTGGYNSASPFVPTSSQWDADTVNLQALAGVQQVRLMFRCVGGASQDLYLDDINLSVLTATQAPQQPAQLKILAYPNPATMPPTLELRLGQATLLNAQLVDLAGRVAFSWEPQKLGAGIHFLEISAVEWGKMPAGLYFLKVNSLGLMGCVKIVKDRQ